MAAGLILTRTKANALDDADPRLGVFVPPPLEIFKPSSLASGYRFALVFTGSVIATATVIVYAKDTTTNSWFLVRTHAGIGNRIFVTKCGLSGAHDLWLGLADITGGTPIKVYVEEVD